MAKTSKYSPLMGVVFAALFVPAMFVNSTPSSNDPAKWVSFYAKHSNQLAAVVDAYLFVLAALALLGFLLVLRTRLDGAMPAFAFYSGLIATAGLTVAGGLLGTVGGNLLFNNSSKNFPIDGNVANYVTSTGFPVLLVSSMLPLAFCLGGFAYTVIRTGALPAWIGWFAILPTLGLLFAVVFLPILLLPAFTLIIGVALTLRPSPETATATLSPA
jgi:hypothetical protein